MAADSRDNVREYYRLITELDIGDVARELLAGRIVQESPKLLQCDCPIHKSQSRRALHVILDKQCWFCFGCGVGGDVLQLVEFVQSGRVTSGQSGPMPESHRQARDYLAQKAGLPPLSSYGLSAERLTETEAARVLEVRVQDTLTAIARYYNLRLKASPKVFDWLISKYGISVETIDTLLIGYSDNAPFVDGQGTKHSGTISALTGGDEGYSPRDLAATGAFTPTTDDNLLPAFVNRIIFPYWSRGRVVFLIGRKTPWTPDNEWEQGKYKKLKCHDEHSRRHIAPCINNSYLYNEDCLLGRPQQIVITEGVTDCVSLMEHGFAAVSPVTVQIKEDDWQRILPKLAGIETVYICQDNEISEAGMKGALRMARHMADAGIETKVVALPLEEKHASARRELRERFDIDAAVGSRELSKRLAGRSKEDISQAQELLAQAKIDVNEYFVAGHTPQDFEDLLTSALTPLEFSITRLPPNLPEVERNRMLAPILREVAEQSPLEQSRQLRLIQERCGGSSLPIAALKEQVRAIQKERRALQREERRKEKKISSAPGGSCRARVEQVLIDTEAETGSQDFMQAAEAAYDWYTTNGARFFRTREGEPFMFFQDEMFWMDSSDRNRRRVYAAMIYNHTGLVQATPGGRIFTEVLANLATQRGEVRDHFTWLYTDVPNYTVYFNLNNPDREIAKITPDGIEIMKNGGNSDGIILSSSDKIEPVKFLPDVDEDAAEALLRELILENLTCQPGDRVLILAWLSCFLLIEFAGTRPMTRFEGSSACGKTTAAKLITALLYGKSQQKKGTDAANYSDGAQNPLIALDNVEVKDLSDGLSQFLLTTVTGIAKEKRKTGTDTDTVVERPVCLVNTTGIEPLGTDLSEVLSRSFIIRFEMSKAVSGCFLEAKVLARIRQCRDQLISFLMKRTSQVLATLRDGAQERVMVLLHERLGDHNKRRSNDYLSLMYLMMLAGKPEADIEAAITEISPEFIKMVTWLNEVTDESARESNPIATVLSGLFQAYRTALKADEDYSSAYPGKSSRTAFAERYQIQFESEDRIEGVLARDLFIALRRVSKEFGLRFEMQSVQQFVQRFANDLDTIQSAGFEITINNRAHRIRTYDITYLN